MFVDVQKGKFGLDGIWLGVDCAKINLALSATLSLNLNLNLNIMLILSPL